MNIFKKIFTKRKSGDDGIITEEKLLGDGFYSYIPRVSSYTSWAYSCINCRAENVAKAKMYIYSNGKENPEHEFMQLARKTNIRRQSFKLNLFRTVVHLDLFGNSYWLVVRSGKKPIAIFMLNPKYVTPKLDKNNSYIESYQYTGSGSVRDYPASDVIHFMIPSEDNEFKGKATISAFNFTLGIEYLQNLYMRKFYDSGALMDLILETDKNLSDAEFKRLKEEVDAGYRGMKHAGKTLLLEGGTTAKSFQQSMKDVDMIPARKNIRDEILSVFRVPPVLLAATGTQNKATAIVELMVFNDYVINPFIDNFIQEPLNLFIRDNYDRNDSIIFENKFIDDEIQIKYYDMFLRHKVLTPQQVAEEEGYNFNNK